MIKPYKIPKSEISNSIEIKKSKFIATARNISSLKEMREFYLELKAAHPKARHNCWGLIGGAPSESNLYGFSDDGEPNGSAGKPIFSVLSYSEVGQIGIVVTRYFGGIKLGIGGLVKAYTKATQAVLELLETTEFSPLVEITLRFAYDQEPHFRHFIESHNTKKCSYNYNSSVEVVIELNEIENKPLINDIKDVFGISISIQE